MLRATNEPVNDQDGAFGRLGKCLRPLGFRAIVIKSHISSMILCTFHYFAVTSCVLPTNRSESTKFDSIQSDSKFGTYEHKLLGTMGSSSKPLDLIFQYARFDFGNFSSQNIYIYPVGLSELFWLFLKEDAIEKRVCNQSVLCAVCVDLFFHPMMMILSS